MVARLRGGRLLGDLASWLAPGYDHWTDPLSAGISRELDLLDADRLTRVFTELAPRLGPALARWWVWSQGAPYQSGWSRRGFRSPDLETSWPARMTKLRSLVEMAYRWPQEAAWFAGWVSHLGPWEVSGLSELLASEIDYGADDIADALLSSATGRHPISGITVVGLQALLGCSDDSRWDQVGTLLRTAGRQEGLRSAVLEATD